MKNYTVRKYTQQDKLVWNAFVAQACNATFLFDRNFMDYHQDRFQDASLLVWDGNKLLAVLPANQVGANLHSHQGLSYGGLVLAHGLRFEQTAAIFKKILEFAQSEGFEMVYLKQIPLVYHQKPGQQLDWLLFKIQAKLYRADALSVLVPNAKAAYSDNKKRNISKASKLDIAWREEKDLSPFWNEILIPNLMQRHEVQPVHSLPEITMLAQRFPKNIRQFNVYESGQLSGGVTIFETPTVAHCQYISGLPEQNRKGCLDWLFDQLINHVYQDKKYFDFGISNEDQGSRINQGLLHWKERFGAFAMPQNAYEIKTENAVLLEDLWT